jgi:hypothetical protein
MSAEKSGIAAETGTEETPTSRAEIQIEREKVQIERERLALERERLAAERERWKIDDELRPRAEGRGIAVSTLVFMSIICALIGVIAGNFSGGTRRVPRLSSPVNLQSLMAGASTNQSAGASGQVLLRALDAGGGRGAYLLILD